MDMSLFTVCQIIGIPPCIWMIKSPFKIYEFLEVLSASELKREHSILDLGCGTGHWTLSLARQCQEAVGIDISESNIRFARNFVRNSHLKHRVQFLCTTLEQAGFSPGSFDRIFSFCVLEHIKNPEKVLAEVFRILKPGGQLHISVDSLANIRDKALLNKHKQEYSVYRYFTEASLRQQLTAVGFEVMGIYPILKGNFARQEFEKRIQARYKRTLVARIRLYKRFQREDRRSKGQEGVMLIGRARRP